jgi:hypothetical protein
MRGMIHSIMIEDEHDKVSGPGFTRSILPSIIENALANPSASRAPSGVGSLSRALRVSKSTPRESSSDRI